MLSQEVIDKVVERLVNRIEKGNTYVLEQIGKNIKKIGKLSPSKAQQLAQILKYGGDYDKIIKKLSEITNLNVKDIQKIFEELAKNDYAFAKQFYDYRGIKYIPYEENIALKNQVNAIAKATALEYMNIANTSALCVGMVDNNGTTTIKLLKDAYYSIIDEAALNVAQGKETFDSAMYRQIKEIGSGGLKVIFPTTYWGKNDEGMPVLKNRVMRLDSSIRMLMDNSLGKFHQETQETIGKQFGYNGYEISVHSAPAPDHERVQGKQFSIEQYENFQTDLDAVSYDGEEFPAISEETGHDRRSIYEYNCKHYTFSIVLGVSKPAYTNEQLQDIIDKNEKGFEYEGKHYSMYEGTQLQRQIELELRKAKDEQIMGREAGIMENVDKAQQRIKALTQKYKEVLEASKLPSRLDRARVSGYKRISIKNNYNYFNDDTNDFISNINTQKIATINDATKVTVNGKTYRVNKQNPIVHDFNEIPVAEFIQKDLHMDVEYLPNINNEHLGDYILDGKEIWELKTITKAGKNTIKNAMKVASHQAQNVILDLTYSDIYIDKVLNDLDDVFRQRNINKIIIKKENKIIKVLKKRA